MKDIIMIEKLILEHKYLYEKKPCRLIANELEVEVSQVYRYLKKYKIPQRIHESEDLTGLRFSKLLVIERSASISIGKNIPRWKCLCDCGTTTSTLASSLKNGTTCSCGCLRIEKQQTGFQEISGSYWGKIKGCAKRRNIHFDITIEYIWDLFIKQNKRCIITNVDINFPKRYGVDEQSASLDRIDSSKGYVEGNVQWVHKSINFMKMQHSQDYFYYLSKLIYENNKEYIDNLTIGSL